ncbi:UdgX family uracil-DNA binding protein [Streptomyces avidinii]|uniref:Type-4 uracil-DNA glycosylase n=1 Tax=Streptomyces avidinii TaxID=1895 RepID=A0ABS4KXV8_STRAV|nr:UdgX family uracil-DNA binding protein [Streptomyces avidinii]MBP2034877.1 DNA polymerase [Streptomyces avidinii]GGY89562.1 uracil-DNA glycosylase [Streptomyces avidinii]
MRVRTDRGADRDTSADTTADAGAAYDARPYLPRRGGLASLRRAAASCRGCPLFKDATQTVFGAGPAHARLVLVGEQPGDQEDRQGEPFVGPAGRLLRKALDEAGLGDEPVYFTNAVKHFKFTTSERGKRRIHKAPSLREMTACRPWLEEELRLVEPEVVVVLGGTAGKALLGNAFRVSEQRGVLRSLPDRESADAGPSRAGRPQFLATLHPSAVLRAPDREAAYQGLLADLRAVTEALG